MSDERGHDTKGSRKALGAMNAKLKAKIGRLERELASYQREQQPQSAEVVGWRDPAYDWSTCSAEMKKAHPERTYALTDPLYTTPQPSAVPDGLPLVLAGVLFDFAGFLTTRPQVIEVGATANASPMAELVKEFSALRGLSLDDAAVLSWHHLLAAPAAPTVKGVNQQRGEQ